MHIKGIGIFELSSDHLLLLYSAKPTRKEGLEESIPQC